ncbi:hypothetical protein [Nocardia sp. NPDC047654]|uniref:hypothetical protein n=1 Tax=Nocardia sp. NPDC047654 TaxID=3364314 RepID=UPI0037165748
MSDTTNDPILPVPCELDRQLWEYSERIEQVRRDLLTMQWQFSELQGAPESIAVDSLGEPIDPQQATERVLTALVAADAALGATADTLSGARRYSNRLKLTDAAAEVREQRLTAAKRRQRSGRSR